VSYLFKDVTAQMKQVMRSAERIDEKRWPMDDIRDRTFLERAKKDK